LEVGADLGTGPGQVAAVGGANGDSVDCTFCGVGVVLTTTAGYDYPSLGISSATGPKMTCSIPGAASDVMFLGTLVLDAAQPGVYQGSPSSFVESNNCDQLTMSYHLPSDAGTIDCGDSGPFDGSPSCPAGCFSSCADAGEAGMICSPCEPGQSQPVVEYELRNGCGTATPGLGSWTVTLTSVTPAEIPPDSGIPRGVQYDVVHGSLSATLLGGASGPLTVTLAF